MNRDLFLSILALDAYNRGYGERLSFTGNSDDVGTQIGNATVSSQLDTSADSDAQDADFYAIAYDWNGETVISYRGTDNLGADAVSGYGVGAGISGVPQGNLAIEF